MAVPVHPKIALSGATVVPFSAALVAPILRQPCAERLCRPAITHACLNALPKLSFLNGLPFLPQMKARSPIGPASSVRRRTGGIGRLTVMSPWRTSQDCNRTAGDAPIKFHLLLLGVRRFVIDRALVCYDRLRCECPLLTQSGHCQLLRG
jgi:hypothetical protein